MMLIPGDAGGAAAIRRDEEPADPPQAGPFDAVNEIHRATWPFGP